MTTINLSLDNEALYAGCEIEEVGGRLTLVTPTDEAVEIIGRNAGKLAEQVAGEEAVTLTGAMAVWSYLLVFHAVVHRVGEVWYDDGRGNRALIAKH